jgi:hypothetical protein
MPHGHLAQFERAFRVTVQQILEDSGKERRRKKRKDRKAKRRSRDGKPIV